MFNWYERCDALPHAPSGRSHPRCAYDHPVLPSAGLGSWGSRSNASREHGAPRDTRDMALFLLKAREGRALGGVASGAAWLCNCVLGCR